MRAAFAVLLAALLAVAAAPAAARADAALGPRLGVVGDDDVYVGVQGEFGPAVGEATIVPGIDFGLGDGPPTTVNCDLRFYLVRLPETGLRFYGAAGPSLESREDADLGLSLTLGLNIPMHGERRYNLEYRWGLGDLPDHKIGLAVMFGL